jgi:hypothetical protein
LSFEQPLNLSVAQSLLRDSEIAKSVTASGLDIQANMIENYPVFNNQEKNWKVDIPKAFHDYTVNDTVKQNGIEIMIIAI